MQRGKHKLWCFALVVLLGSAVSQMPLVQAAFWEDEKPAPPAPTIKPYEIPTMDGKKPDFHHIPAIKVAPLIDADAVFEMIVNCFPERHKWGLEVKATVGMRKMESGAAAFDSYGLSRHYAGIVAEMPLYSTDEMHRQRTQEYDRRVDIANNVAKLLKGLADRNRALRMIGINESIEARSQIRVKEGITGAEEQITHLKAVATSVADLDEANAAITSARLMLVGQCRDDARTSVNDYLKEVSK